MALTLSAKAPDDIVRYSWAPPLAEGDGLNSYTLTESGCTIDSDEIVGDEIVFFVSAGTAGTIATITAEAVTDDGEELNETLYLPIIATTVAFTTTGQDVVDFALRKIAGLGETADAVESDDALELLNGMLATWRIDGLDLGVPLPVTAATVFKCRDDFIMPLKYNLRVLVHSTYGESAVAALSAVDMRMAEDGKRLVANALFSMPDLTFERGLLKPLPISDAEDL